MRRESSHRWLMALVAMAALAVGAWWLYQDFSQRTAASSGAGETKAAAGQMSEPASRPAPLPRDRTENIIRCTAEDGSVIYTNATSCDKADTDNRVTVVDAWEPAPATPDQRNSMSDAGLDQVAALFLPQCRGPFMEALKVESYLSVADDPVNSYRAEQYCDFIAQGVQAGCMATSAQFCYLDICQKRLQND